MSWGFERGRIYDRRKDIHQRFGGQQQGGIITPANFPMIIIVTGEEGLQNGYADRLLPDGSFEYFGEGQVGPMTLTRGNLAIAEHSRNGKDLLLFRKLKQGLRFEGMMVYDNHHIERAPDRENNERDAIVFSLRPLEAVVEAETDLPRPKDALSELRRLAFAAAMPTVPGTPGIRTVYQRSNDVRAYVLARAGDRCEGGGEPAPFRRPDGSPYLEPHHLRRLSDGGPDDPRFVIALCPNCHRRVHAGADGPDCNDRFMALMGTIEPGRPPR